MNNLREHLTLSQPTINEIFSRLEMKLRLLAAVIAGGIRPHDATDQFVEIHSLLEALPFTAAEFSAAKHRLRNTVADLHCGERRASLDELKLLRQLCGR